MPLSICFFVLFVVCCTRSRRHPPLGLLPRRMLELMTEKRPILFGAEDLKQAPVAVDGVGITAVPRAGHGESTVAPVDQSNDPELMAVAHLRALCKAWRISKD